MSGSAILCLSSDHKILELSNEAERVFGWRREHVVNEDFFNLSHADSMCGAVAREIQQVLEGDDSRTFESVLEIDDAHSRTYMWNVSRMSTPKGRHAGIIAIGQDISQLKRTEDALRASEGKYRDLVQNANSIIMRRDTNGVITFFNEYAQRFFGYSEREIIGRNVVGAIVPERDSSGADLGSMIRDVARNPEQYALNENENMRRNGERVWVAWTNKAIRDAEGNVKEILCVGTDITRRKDAEEALRLRDERYRLLFNSGTDAVVVYPWGAEDAPGRFVEVNDIACERLGYSREEILNLTPRDIVLPDAWPAMLDMQRRLRVKSHQLHELVCLTSQGEHIPIEASGHLFELNGQLSVLAVLRDLTERKRLESQLVQSQKMEAIGRLAGGVAHDFNNLLTVIMGYCELMLSSMDEEAPHRREALEIRKSGQRAVSLTRQLLAFSRRQVMVARELDLNAVVEDLGPMLRRLIGEHLELVFDLFAAPVYVKADPAHLEQVVMKPGRQRSRRHAERRPCHH